MSFMECKTFCPRFIRILLLLLLLLVVVVTGGGGGGSGSFVGNKKSQNISICYWCYSQEK